MWLDGTVGMANVEIVSALERARRYRFRRAALDWDFALNWVAALSYTDSDYNDGNRQTDARATVIRKLNRYLSAGYSLWLGDSRFVASEYWTPKKLVQHMGTLGYIQQFGETLEASGRPKFETRLNYGAGYGFQETGSRFVQRAGGAVTWRLSDVLFVDAEAQYLRSPLYDLKLLTAGIGLQY
jgi:hypothetical protein